MSSLQVVAFHGLADPGHSPALRGPVVVDGEGRLLRSDGTVDSEVVISADGPLPGEGTRIGPWPYKKGHFIITIDASLLDDVRAFASTRRVVSSAVRVFLDAAVSKSTEALSRYHAEHLVPSGVIAWYASRHDIDPLRKLVRTFAKVRLTRVLIAGSNNEIQEAAWQLQRAALVNEDDLRALVALQYIGRLSRAEATEFRRLLVRGISPSAARTRFNKILRAMKKSARRARH